MYQRERCETGRERREKKKTQQAVFCGLAKEIRPFFFATANQIMNTLCFGIYWNLVWHTICDRQLTVRFRIDKWDMDMRMRFICILYKSEFRVVMCHLTASFYVITKILYKNFFLFKFAEITENRNQDDHFRNDVNIKF